MPCNPLVPRDRDAVDDFRRTATEITSGGNRQSAQAETARSNVTGSVSLRP